MRKFLPALLILLCVVVFSTGVVFAKDSQEINSSANSDSGEERSKLQKMVNSSSRLEEKSLRQKDKRQDWKNHELEKKKDSKEYNGSRSAEFKQKATEELKKNFGKLDVHLIAYLNRLDKILEKINSRIGKLKVKGVDTAAAEAKMVEVKVLRDNAKAAIDKAKADMDSINSTTATKESVAGARRSVDAAKKALVAYHKGLSDVVRVLAKLSGHREGTESAKEGTNGADKK